MSPSPYWSVSAVIENMNLALYYLLAMSIQYTEHKELRQELYSIQMFGVISVE